MSTSLVAFQAAALRGRQFSGYGSGGVIAAAIARGRFNNRTGAFSGFGDGEVDAEAASDESPLNASSGDSSDEGDASAAWYTQMDWGGLATGLGQGAGAILQVAKGGMAPGTPGTVTLPGGAVVPAGQKVRKSNVFTPKNLAIGGALLAGLFIAHKKGMF